MQDEYKEQAHESAARARLERCALIAARERLHLSQEEVAERIGISKSTVHRWEKAGDIPQPYHLRKLCELFGLSAQELGFEEKYEVAEIAPVPEEPASDALALFRQQCSPLRLMRVVWNWPLRNVRYQELQASLVLELEGTNQMKPDDLLTRRDTLRLLAALPIEMCGLSALHPTLKRPHEEILAQCAAGITACWYLRKGKELAFAYDAVSAYIPTLGELTKVALTPQKKAAADLLAQCFLLKSPLARHLKGNNEAINYARQAEIYGKLAENAILHILSVRTQAAAYSYANQWEQALRAAEKAQYLLETSPVPVSPLVQSFVYVGLANYKAYNGLKGDALTTLGKAHTTFFAQPAKDGPPIWIAHDQANLVLNDGTSHFHIGMQKQAIDSFAQIASFEGMSESIRVEALIAQVMAEISREDQPRDMEKCIACWIEGIEGAKALQSNQRYNEALQAYTAMRAAWPTEQRIKYLREYLVHW